MSQLHRVFEKLEAGSILPEGWLKRYVRVTADGWLLDMAVQRHKNVWYKFFESDRNRTHENLYDENNQGITCVDYTAYFADAMMRFAILDPKSRLAAHAEEWVSELLKSQDEDGYIGAFVRGCRFKHWLEVFSICLTVEALNAWGDAKGDPRVLDCAKRAYDRVTEAWYEPETVRGIYETHGTLYVRLAPEMYRRYGEERYLRTAEEVQRTFGWQESFLKMDREPGFDPLYYKHLAVGAEHVCAPAYVYEMDGNKAYLRASENGFRAMQEKHLSKAGTPLGAELLLHQGPRYPSEHCGSIEWLTTCENLTAITGEAKYADAAEWVFFNAYPAPRSYDAKTTQYSHADNQLFGTETSNPHNYAPGDWWASRAFFHSCQEPLCCNCNGPRGIPNYIDYLVMRTADAVVFPQYGPCRAAVKVAGGELRLEEDTNYPFEEEIRIRIRRGGAACRMKFRIPSWATGAEISVNGQPAAAACEAGTFAEIEGNWRTGDEIVLRLDCRIELEPFRRAEFNMRPKGVVVRRGPLLYALKVRERWERFDPPASAPAQEKENIRAYRLLPQRGEKWNVALDVDFENPEAKLEFCRLEPPKGRPFERAPVGIRARGRLMKEWTAGGNAREPKTPLFPLLPVTLGEEREVMLVPFACTKLRFTYIPVIEGEDGADI